jgi:cobalt-zinc-cadmium efflux system outer membrane protein
MRRDRRGPGLFGESRRFAALPFATILAGCAVYHPNPLDRGQLDAALAPPDNMTLALEAERLRHPRIPPIVLDFSKPLTGKEFAVIAVWANPDLKTLRAEEGAVRAQVFRAGLLPDPQISAGLDRPLNRTPDRVRWLVEGVNL